MKVRGSEVALGKEAAEYKCVHGSNPVAQRLADITTTVRKRPAVNQVTQEPQRSQVGNLAPSPQYRSKWESAYAAKLELEKRAGLIKAWSYEGITFRLAHGQYHRIDFLIWHLDNSIEMAQVKGR